MTPLVPAYWPPADPRWGPLLDELEPGAIVVANPHNGFAVSGEWHAHIAAMQARGLRVVGYVATGWMRRAATDIVAECAAYRSYGVDGIFFDEVAEADVKRFLQIHGYARAMRKRFFVFNAGLAIYNPGVASPSLPLNLPGSIWVTHETMALPDAVTGPRGRNAALVHHVVEHPGWYRDHLGRQGWAFGWAAIGDWHGDHG